MKFTNFFERLSIYTSNRFHIYYDNTRGKESQRLATVLRGGGTEVEFQSKDVLLFPEKFRAALGPTQPPIQWAPPYVFRDKEARAWLRPLSST